MMKVAYILPWANYGGTEQSTFNLCKFSERTMPFVLALSEGEILNEFRREGFEIHVVPITEEKNALLFDQEKALNILKRADLINFVFFQGYHPLTFDIIKKTGLPYVTTVRWLYQVPVIDCKVICVSYGVQAIQDPRNDSMVIQNGVDISKFRFQPKPCQEKVVITRICRTEKCADYFWPALNKVLETFPNAELWIVGEDGISTPKIKFLGLRRDIPDILAKTDIFAYTPRPGEGALDNVILEAMAMGTPCVLSDVECVREPIINRKNGILVPYEDQEAFAGEICHLIKEKALREEMGRNALQTIKENFDVKNVVKKYEDVYISLLSGTE